MTLLQTLSTVILTATLFGCSENTASNNEEEPFNPEAISVVAEYDREISKLVDTANAPDLNSNFDLFSRRLFTEVQKSRPDENIMISPFSISTALSMTVNGSAEPTTTEMLNGLSLEGVTLKEANSYNSLLAHNLTDNKHLIFNNANSIWTTERYTPLKRSFYEIVTDYYLADIFPLTGIDPVNQWISDKTNGKIPKMLNELPTDVAMLLVNAVYFKGNWETKFDTASTYEQEFTTASAGKVTVDMMHMDSSLSFKKGKDYKAVSLPYKDENTSLYVFLPDAGVSLDEFIAGTFMTGSNGGYGLPTTNYDTWEIDWDWQEDNSETLFSHFNSKQVYLSLPKFKFEFGASLVEPLKALGMETIFTTASDFTNFADERDPFVGDVLHKSFIEVNETGTEAAAATVVVMTDEAMELVTIMAVDHPFLFCVRNNETGTILFMGQVTDPTEE